MNSKIVIGPIQKPKPQTERSSVLNERMSKMKVGNFFEVSGLSTKSEILNFRASVQYASKKKNIRVVTNMASGVLRVERVKSIKTKEVSKVK
jgi:hypothetical protein